MSVRSLEVTCMIWDLYKKATESQPNIQYIYMDRVTSFRVSTLKNLVKIREKAGNYVLLVINSICNSTVLHENKTKTPHAIIWQRMNQEHCWT